MAFKSFVVFAVVGIASIAASAIDPLAISECGTPPPSTEFLESIQQVTSNGSFIAEASSALSSSSYSSSASGEKQSIITYIHVIASGYQSSDGYISRQDTFDQIDFLNSGFESTNFYFLHKGTSWTVDANWANGGDDLAMKKALRRGDHRTLNIYVQPSVGGSSKGFCYYPRTLPSGSDEFYLDGCNVRTDTVVPTKQGTTTTHEVGHWLGLMHTFEGGCDGDGDLVDDTPACTTTYSCNYGQDTCPGRPGADDVTNYMSYNSCRSHFTTGQNERMWLMYWRYRNPF